MAIYNNKEMNTMENIKRCHYRNCMAIVNGNTKKRFCCDNCRKNEFTYVKRDRKSLKDKSNMYKKLIKESQSLEDKNLLDLYKLIYK